MTLARQQQRRDTAANWASVNPVLLDGEIGYDQDADRIKVGDGTTAWVDLAYADQLEASQQAVTDAQAQVLAAQQQVVAAQSAAAAAAASAAAAEQVTGIDTTDAAVAYTVAHGNAVTDALTRTAAVSHKHPLTRFMDYAGNYATNRVVRMMLKPTSIGTFDNSAVQVLPEQVARLVGESAYDATCLGALGGSYDNPVSGWVKQRYGGNQFTRLRGDSSSGLLDLGWKYADTITLESSRETTSEAVNVRVDGVVVGQTPGPGAQLYRQVLTATVPLGLHHVTVDAPTGSGYAHLETFITADSARRTGLEVLNYGLGGTGLKHMITLYDQAKFSAGYTGPQVPGIPIVGDNGLDYHFNRDDIDLFVIEGPVNDSGSPERTRALEFGVEQARQRDVPMLLIIEMLQQYATDANAQASRLHMLAMGRYEWVTVIDWHGMMWPGADLLDNSLTAKFLSLYFPGGGGDPHPGPTPHMALTGAVMRLCTLPLPDIDSAQVLQTRRLEANTLPQVTQRRPDVTLFSRTYPLPEPEGTAHHMLEPFGTARSHRVENYYRLPLTLGFRDGMNNVAGSWLENTSADRAGTDRFGRYVDQITDAQGYHPQGTLMRLTIRVRKNPNAGNGTISVTLDGGARFEDDKGNQMPTNSGSGSSATTRLFYSLTAETDPVVLTWLYRVTGTEGGNAQVGDAARIYEATCLPVANASVPPILDSSATSYDFLRALPAARNVPTTVLLGNGTSRRFTSTTGGAYELSAQTADQDLYPSIYYDGTVVPYFRDTTVPQLGRAGDGGGGFGSTDYNTAIQGSSTTDSDGVKYAEQNFTPIGWTATAGQEFTVLARLRQIIAVEAGGNTQLIVNGVVRTGRAWFYYGTDAAHPPVWMAYRVRAVADGTVSINVRGWLYEVHVTNTSHPVKTT